MAATATMTQRNLNATPQVVKGGETYLCSLQVLNTSAAAAYVQLFDAQTAGAVTLGTTVPDMEVLVPATTGYVTVPLPADGVQYDAGLVVASTTLDMGTVGSAAGVTVFAQIM